MALIASAFFAPQILFQVQDAILCREIVHEQQESMNVEALSTTYEQSLAARMRNYAEGQAAGSTFFVTSQELAETSEVREYIYSDNGIYGQLMGNLIEYGLLPTFIWEMGFVVEDCRQYVIYSDDFTKGVNFILWYIEMQDDNGVIFKLLADAEDGTLYAVKTEGNGHGATEETADANSSYISDFFWGDEVATRMWAYCASVFKALDDSELKALEIMVGEYGWSGDGLVDGRVNGENEQQGIVAEDTNGKQARRQEILTIHEEWGEILEKVQYYMSGEDAMFFLLPYGDAVLDLVIKASVSEDPVIYIYGTPDVTIGIRQIYEMIPEFA